VFLKGITGYLSVSSILKFSISLSDNFSAIFIPFNLFNQYKKSNHCTKLDSMLIRLMQPDQSAFLSDSNTMGYLAIVF
jgi:hypothetical protein